MLQARAMLARLSISQWTARKQDKRVAAEVELAHAAHDAGNYNKLLVNKNLLEPIAKVTAKIRDVHYNMTLPWADSGARLLPTTLFLDHAARIRELKDKFESLVLVMKSQYPAEVQAARNRLGTMYDPGDYPSVEDLHKRFAVNLEFTPVPDASDFRVDVSDEIQAELRASVTEAVHARQTEAVQACYSRIRDVVSKIEERLSKEDAIFKDTLIFNAIELCQVLEGLNITDDPLITELCKDMRDNLLMPPSALRNNPTLRHQVANAAFKILEKLP